MINYVIKKYTGFDFGTGWLILIINVPLFYPRRGIFRAQVHRIDADCDRALLWAYRAVELLRAAVLPRNRQHTHSVHGGRRAVRVRGWG